MTNSRRRRRGFTLFETMIALALTAVILTAVYAALDLVGQLQNRGRDRYEDGQVLRSVMQMLQRDVRSIVFREPDEEDEDGAVEAADEEDESAAESETDEESEDEEPTTIDVLDATSAYGQAVVGVYGDASVLMLHVSRPDRDSAYAGMGEAVAVGSRTSDLRSVAYFLAAAGGNGLSAATAARAASAGLEAPAGDGVYGLARLDGDRLTMQAADAQADLETLAAHARVLAPEVVTLQFRYFDGLEWFDAWDSEQLAAVPRAIEVTIGIRRPDREPETAGRFTTFGSTAPPELHRFVIAVPVSQPLAGDVGI